MEKVYFVIKYLYCRCVIWSNDTAIYELLTKYDERQHERVNVSIFHKYTKYLNMLCAVPLQPDAQCQFISYNLLQKENYQCFECKENE